MKVALVIIAILITLPIYAQVNCEAYKYSGDEQKYKACKAAERRSGHYQFSRFYQQALDDALAIDSSFTFAYQAKSTAYLKSGDFITWKALMDKAVAYDPVEHLYYRGWCRYQFFRDYKGAIEDIELLDSLIDYDIGFSQNGDYHLHIARALCYKALGKPQKAIEIIETQFKNEEHYAGKFDYLHLGVLYLETGNYQKAIENLQKQEKENDLAENRYYIALAYKQIGVQNLYQENLQLALEKYKGNLRMSDPYSDPMDKIYLADIEEEMQK